MSDFDLQLSDAELKTFFACYHAVCLLKIRFVDLSPECVKLTDVFSADARDLQFLDQLAERLWKRIYFGTIYCYLVYCLPDSSDRELIAISSHFKTSPKNCPQLSLRVGHNKREYDGKLPDPVRFAVWIEKNGAFLGHLIHEKQTLKLDDGSFTLYWTKERAQEAMQKEG